MLSQFPHFKKLHLEDKEDIEKIISKFPPYSDYNFTSLYGYDTEDEIEVSVLHNNLVIMFTDYITNKPFYSFIGTEKSFDTANILLSEAKKRHIIPYLKLIPEIAITQELKTQTSLLIEEDQDNFDYILSIEDIATLNNKHYNKKKHFMHFVQNYPNRSVVELHFDDPHTKQQIIQLFNTWQEDKGRTHEETQTELNAITRTIDDNAGLKLVGLGIYVEDKMIAFSIATLENNGYVQFHFVKADKSYSGIFAAIYIYLAQYLNRKKYKFMNIEQDLGIEGLRKSKEQWHPVKFLKKYTIKSKA